VAKLLGDDDTVEALTQLRQEYSFNSGLCAGQSHEIAVVETGYRRR